MTAGAGVPRRWWLPVVAVSLALIVHAVLDVPRGPVEPRPPKKEKAKRRGQEKTPPKKVKATGQRDAATTGRRRARGASASPQGPARSVAADLDVRARQSPPAASTTSAKAGTPSVTNGTAPSRGATSPDAGAAAPAAPEITGATATGAATVH